MTAKNASIAVIFGRRGTGKSTLAKALTRDTSRIFAFDPIGEYHLEGFRPAATMKDVLALTRRHRAGGFRIAYQPDPDRETPPKEFKDYFYPWALHRLAKLAWEIQKPYFEGRDRRELTLLVDEMNLSYPVASLPHGLGGMDRLVLQGRHAGINLLGITQRPALVSTNFRDNAQRTYILPLNDHNSISAVLQLIGRRHEDKVQALTAHHWLLWQDGALTEGENAKFSKVK